MRLMSQIRVSTTSCLQLGESCGRWVEGESEGNLTCIGLHES